MIFVDVVAGARIVESISLTMDIDNVDGYCGWSAISYSMRMCLLVRLFTSCESGQHAKLQNALSD